VRVWSSALFFSTSFTVSWLSVFTTHRIYLAATLGNWAVHCWFKTPDQNWTWRRHKFII
jgi:hypothetical protein